MKKLRNVVKLCLHRETLRRLDMNELHPVAGGVTGPDSHCTTALNCPSVPPRCPR